MRDCKNCVHYTPDGCESWDCEYISRAEAIECYEIVKAMRETKGIITTGTPIIPISSTSASTNGGKI